MKFIKTLFVFVVISAIFSHVASLTCWDCRGCEIMGLSEKEECRPLHKSCSTQWYSGTVTGNIFSIRECSYETGDGCIVKNGLGGGKQPWCYCNTSLCNNLTLEQTGITVKPPRLTKPPTALKCWECVHCKTVNTDAIHMYSKEFRFLQNNCIEFYKSCSTRWYHNVWHGGERRSDHYCSYEDIDGCCIKEGGNKTETWCFCKTDFCNNVTTLPTERLPRCATLKLSNGTLVSAVKLPFASNSQLSPRPEIFLFFVSVVFASVFCFL